MTQIIHIIISLFKQCVVNTNQMNQLSYGTVDNELPLLLFLVILAAWIQMFLNKFQSVFVTVRGRVCICVYDY